MKRLPIGIDDFRKIRENDYYYVDKSLLVKELLDNHGEVVIFNRPRRFGKTLALSMLRYFFERPADNEVRTELFEGLAIMEAGERYTRYKGRYPVVSLTLKSAKQGSFELSRAAVLNELAKEYERHRSVLQSSRLSAFQKEQFTGFMEKRAKETEIPAALEFLTRMLHLESGSPVIVLLDEYDVPLENAWLEGFYKEMAGFVRALFEMALKSNSSLEFAVVTGCLRIAKESVFTGLNNLDVVSVLNRTYAEHFGFTETEIERFLLDYGLSDRRDEVRDWYDGYLFGATKVYNPWSVSCYVRAVAAGEEQPLKPYWVNTSSNDIVRRLVERADASARQELEVLIAGGAIEKPVHEDITYDEAEKSQDNLWNFLFFTGYLKKVSSRLDMETNYVTLAIPNAEVRYIYRNKVLEWYDGRLRQKDFTTFYQAVLRGDREALERELSRSLMETISFYDYREEYYHAYTAGLLKFMDGYLVKSNRESGLGRSDIELLSAPYEGIAVIIEVKVADSYAEMNQKAEEALWQIRERQYGAELREEGYHTFIRYGIAFYKKLCRVCTEKTTADARGLLPGICRYFFHFF